MYSDCRTLSLAHPSLLTALRGRFFILGATLAWTRIPADLRSCDVGPECGAGAAFQWHEVYESPPRTIEGVEVIKTKKFNIFRCESHAPIAPCQLGECEHGACVVDRGMGSRGA